MIDMCVLRDFLIFGIKGIQKKLERLTSRPMVYGPDPPIWLMSHDRPGLWNSEPTGGAHMAEARSMVNQVHSPIGFRVVLG